MTADASKLVERLRDHYAREILDWDLLLEAAAALEAARVDGVKFVELVESSKELLTEWDRQDNGRFDTMSAKWWEEAEARFRIAVAESEGRSLECNCPGSGKAFASQHAPNCPARPIYVLNPGERNGNGI